MEPLRNNPKRQATQALKGYSYQIWQSLLRWIELEENQLLILEGAEDIDLYSFEGTETIQVKDISESGTVTLRSLDIIESINNFWELQSKNPNRPIKFRFLTTAEAGYERPSPFGNIRGLD